MLGSKSGVATRLKESFPQLIVWHCLNHRIELAVTDSIEQIEGCFPMISFFKKIYSIYSTSPKRCRELHEIAEDLEMQVKKIGKIFSIRWVASSYRTVNAVWSNYPALHRHFQEVSTSPDTKSAERYTYKGLANKLATTEFVEDLALLKDCLGQLSILSLNLQNEQTTYDMASRNIQWTLNALKKIKKSVSDGKYKFSNIVDESSPTFKGVSLSEYKSRHEYNSFDHSRFMQTLIENIESRTTNQSQRNQLAEFEILNPDKWPINIEAPWLEGEEILLNICQTFSINTTGIIESFREFVDNPRTSNDVMKKKVFNGLINLIPISSAAAERGFSVMNLVCTDLRSSIKISNVAAQMFISINGPPTHLWNPERALRKWLTRHRSALDNQSRKVQPQVISDLSFPQKLFC